MTEKAGHRGGKGLQTSANDCAPPACSITFQTDLSYPAKMLPQHGRCDH